MIASLKNFFLENIANSLAKKRVVILRYNDDNTIRVFDVIQKIKKDREIWLTYNELYQVYALTKSVEKIKGDIAEVGVYKGGSAKIISKAKGKKTLHLFDTFDGLPDPTKNDDERHYKGRFATQVEEVKNYLKNEKNVFFYVGFFPKTAAPIEKKKFSFVHLDVDLYKSTKDCLQFFYPRMNKGGVILSHDYIGTPGVRKAFHEFLKDKPEPIIEMTGTQCLIVKV